MKSKLDKILDNDFVEFCYENLLGRHADLGGQEHYRRQLKKGVSRLEIVEKFISSEEYSLHKKSPFVKFSPPGHFYSPLPKLEDVSKYYEKIIETATTFEGIDIRHERQIEILNRFKVFYPDLPFRDYRQASLRYSYKNNQFGHGDAIVLYSMLRLFKPNSIIEIGSGHSSAVMLDTKELFLNDSVKISFIEPYPERLHKILKKRDRDECRIIERSVQEIAIDELLSLSRNDIMFIDCSHVVKFGSDLSYLLFSVIPLLKPGVILHFHDIFWPFEYPREWLVEGRAWNESYFLRAFLSFNSHFEILYFSDFMGKNHLDLVKRAIPLSEKNPGCSLWLRKKA